MTRESITLVDLASGIAIPSLDRVYIFTSDGEPFSKAFLNSNKDIDAVVVRDSSM
jgi:hypothetical protein